MKRTRSSNYRGQVTKSWADFLTRSASVEPLQGRELFAAQQIKSETTVKIKMRYDTGLDVIDVRDYQIKIEDLNTPKMLVNGDFATDSVWIKGVGWTIAGGVADCDGSQAGSTYLEQATVLTIGDEVVVTFTISNFAAGTVKVLAGNGTSGTVRTANGTYTETLTVSGNGSFFFQADLNFIGQIDDVSVRLAGSKIYDIHNVANQYEANREVWFMCGIRNE